ncbi:HhH-GDP family DNA glycosylase [Streptomyces nodosus]|uniref:Endonuclease n=1 Tax=Streptomyces nodosus TaxID=40318 RepID=A0A0B5DEJ7_9ACTN|nr:endonuclease [Streptomyces nodosus]AJE39600.1 endonuclease [Streptomyces nodosus]MBB4790557.1 endonuclease III [Streptomyces nodosus]QEV38184.1 endonuclease [Streptomyces nodosus]
MSPTTRKNPRDRTEKAVAQALLDRQEATYLAQAGVRLRNTPGPLYQALVLAMLFSARIKADIAVAAARALFEAGLRTAQSMAKASWQQRVDALGEGGYRRYDERTATMLGEGAELLLERYGGDLRKLREEDDPKKALREIPGLGPTGVDIFLRAVQTIWPEFAPYVDRKAQDGARRLGLPTSPDRLATLVSRRELARFTDGLVHAALDKPLADDVLAEAKPA